MVFVALSKSREHEDEDRHTEQQNRAQREEHLHQWGRQVQCSQRCKNENKQESETHSPRSNPHGTWRRHVGRKADHFACSGSPASTFGGLASSFAWSAIHFW